MKGGIGGDKTLGILGKDHTIKFNGANGERLVTNPIFLADYSLAEVSFSGVVNMQRFQPGYERKFFYGEKTGSDDRDLPIGGYRLKLRANRHSGFLSNEQTNPANAETVDIWYGNFICTSTASNIPRQFWQGPILFQIPMHSRGDLEQTVFHEFKLSDQEPREEIIERILAGLEHQEREFLRIMS